MSVPVLEVNIPTFSNLGLYRSGFSYSKSRAPIRSLCLCPSSTVMVSASASSLAMGTSGEVPFSVVKKGYVFLSQFSGVVAGVASFMVGLFPASLLLGIFCTLHGLSGGVFADGNCGLVMLDECMVLCFKRRFRHRYGFVCCFVMRRCPVHCEVLFTVGVHAVCGVTVLASIGRAARDWRIACSLQVVYPVRLNLHRFL